MSKINAVRFINLNYNNNSIRIADEVFQFGGQSTLLSLRNGGGKSVLVQMMTAPFVHKQYRKTKDRPFESYFTTAKPTFILVEWKLDRSAGYCLTGMMVRRNQSLEEQSSEPLEIINFISEYPSRCEQDIYHIPLVEKSKNEIILKNYNACQQIFEGYKKDPEKKFFYYDMNNSAQSRQYFDKLTEYKIHYKEWESIIRKVNLKESGLSELFSDCKNEKELVEKWFVEAIESKLNREQNRMKEFQTIIEKYVQMYKDNKSKIDRRDTILKFKEDMQDVEETARIYLGAEQKVKSSENRIASFLQELYRLEEIAEEKLQTLKEEKETLEDKIAYIIYEKLSMELHRLEEELRRRSSNCDMIGLEMDNLEREISRIEHKLHLMECARQQLVVDESLQEHEYVKQKIEVSRKNEEELEPERKWIGRHLKTYYTDQLTRTNLALEQKEADCQHKNKQIAEQKEREKECQTDLENLLVKISAYRTRMERFEDKEQEYNRNYRETFTRNILGEYDPGMLEIRNKEYEKQFQELIRDHKNHNLEQMELQEKKKIQERDREDKLEEKHKSESKLQILQKQGEEYGQQIKDRQKLMQYLEVEDALLWQKEKILEVIDHKLSQIDVSRGKLEQEERELQKEWKKLTSGEVLELPQDFGEMLQELELHPVYGMNWLEKNGYSREENQRLVRTQPFLPYSLILPKAEIKKLQTYGKEIYTSYPVPLLARENLEEILMEEPGSILNLSGVSFYLWFNEKLLDPEALRTLILEKEQQITRKQEQVKIRRQEYMDYSNKRSLLERQTMTKEKVDRNRSQQEEMTKKLEQLEQEIRILGEAVLEREKEIRHLMQTIFEEKQTLEYYKRREHDFTNFCAEYEAYQENRKKIEQCNREKEKLEEKKKNVQNLVEKYTEELKSMELECHQFVAELKKIKEKVFRFAVYEMSASESQEEGLTKEAKAITDKLKEKSPEELEARYEAITGGISLELQELEERLKKAGRKLDQEREELKKRQKKYLLQEEEWKAVIYNAKEQNHQEMLLEDRKKKYKGKERLWNDEDKQVAVINSKIKGKRQDILEQCGYEEALPKNEIITIDYESDMNQLKYQVKELEKETKRVEAHRQSLEQNLTALSEYQDFEIVEDITWNEEVVSMDARTLRDFTGIMRRDYRQDIERQNREKDKIQTQLNALVRKGIYQEDYYRKPLETMLSVMGQAQLLLAQFSATIQSYDSQMEKLIVDIAMVEKEKEKIAGLLEDYVKEVHTNMSRIDNNSTITIRERPIKMLRLQIPHWEENEGLYRQRMNDYMDELTKNGVEIYEKNENPANYFSSRITTKCLYDTIVGIGNIQIKLYKIEEQREYPITWAEVAKNSGGEGFLSAFVILSSLLHYMRRDETDIFADKNEGKVLVMDNPFAQTNAAHLLKPLMDMAKKANTQLICLSGLGGDSIYSRFDNIYVLNLVAAKLRGGIQYLRGEHKRGIEEEIMVTSQIEVIGQQMLLF